MAIVAGSFSKNTLLLSGFKSSGHLFFTKPLPGVPRPRRVADGGPDHPENVIALCPNCYRRLHHAKYATCFNVQLVEVAKAAEAVIRRVASVARPAEHTSVARGLAAD